MKVAILGSGNGGCAAAADWALAGHEVSLFDLAQFPETIEAVKQKGGVQAEGELSGFAPVAYSGHCAEMAIAGAALILAVGPSYSTAPFAEAVKDCIKADQIYVVCPGSCGGALLTKKIFADSEEASRCTIAETSTLPYAARNTTPGSVKIFLKLRGGLLLSALPNDQTGRVMEVFSQVYQGAVKAKNVLQTMLQNGNPVIHPSVVILNAGRVERTHGDFLFYEDGVTPAVGKLIKAVDEERMMIGRKLGVEVLPDPEIGVLQGYMTDTSYEYGYAQAPGFKGIMALGELDNRFLNEDVGYGLVFMAELAKKLELNVPVIDAVIQIAAVLREKDYRGEAVRTLDAIGFSLEEVLKA